MARRTKEEAEKTRKRIMASALSLFAKRGYDRTTFNDIAARLGLTKGAVYWHFESKQTLLLALLDEMLEKFRRQITALLPPGETSFEGLSFPVVADMLVRSAAQLVKDPQGPALFLVVQARVKWADASMAKVREDLFRNQRFGPWAAVRTAVENDVKAGRVRRDIDPVQVASVCTAMWDGLVHMRIVHMLRCDLEATLRKSYAAVWEAMKVVSC